LIARSGLTRYIHHTVDISIVAPAFDEALALPPFIRRTTAVLDELGGSGELILVDDGSNDETWQVIEAASQVDPRIHGIRLARNFGHQLALTAGLAAADGDAVVTLDADLQHPPEIIPELVAAAALGYDVVYAVRSVDDAARPFKRLSAKLFYSTLNRLTSLELPEGAGDFRYMSRRVVNVLLAMPERHRFLRGMTRWAGFRQTFVSYDRGERHGGQSKYGLAKMMMLAWDAVTSFSAIPLRFAGLMGLAVSLLGFVYLGYAIAIHLFTRTTVSGWTSVTAAVLVLGGVQLICLGIFGQYLGRMYEDVKGRPLFLVDQDTRGRIEQSGLTDFHPTLLTRGRGVESQEQTLRT
jgi:glycosyltransferase involved in cell wall biosynthesis